MGDEKLIEVSVAARKLCVSERTIYRMLKDPDCELKAVKVYKQSVRIIASSIENFFKDNPANSANR